MKAEGFGASHQGREKTSNEDFFLVDNELGLYIVCDGKSGPFGGRLAAETAARTVVSHIRQKKAELEKVVDSEGSHNELVKLVNEAIQTASHQLYALGLSTFDSRGMHTTLTLVLLAGTKAIMGHVGNSRLFLYRRGELHQLSRDHTLSNDLLRGGRISSEDATRLNKQTVLSRCLGERECLEVDTLLFDILPNDALLLCTDGLTRKIQRFEDIERIIGGHDREEIPQRLIEYSNSRRGKGNVTTVFVHTQRGVDHGDSDDFAQEVELKIESLRSVYLFNQLTLEELLWVMDAVSVSRLSVGELLIREGEQSNSLYVILDGELVVSRGGIEITKLRRGNHVGEMALLNDTPRSATVTAASPSRVLVLEREKFQQLLLRGGTLGVKLLWNLSVEMGVRLEHTNRQCYGPLPHHMASAVGE